MKKISKLLLLVAIFSMLLTSCTEQVPPGYVGMVMTPNGLKDETLEPGNHTCYNRDKMVLIETKEATITEKLSVLCADDLNFGFDLKVRSSIDATDLESIKRLLSKQGANIEWNGSVGVLKFDYLYKTYVSPLARSIARTVVSKYQTTQIRDNREKIQKEIFMRLKEAMKGTPMQVRSALTSNFDYPAVITKAVENKRKREIEIEEEKAVQAMQLLRMNNRQELAKKARVVRAAEAEAEAIYNRVLSGSLTPNYLRLRAIERDIILYEKIGQGDKLIVTDGNPNLILSGK